MRTPPTPAAQELGSQSGAGFPQRRVAFVTADLDRSHAGFKKTITDLAWRSFAWFAAEPERLVALHDGVASLLALASLMVR